MPAAVQEYATVSVVPDATDDENQVMVVVDVVQITNFSWLPDAPRTAAASSSAWELSRASKDPSLILIESCRALLFLLPVHVPEETCVKHVAPTVSVEVLRVVMTLVRRTPIRNFPPSG